MKKVYMFKTRDRSEESCALCVENVRSELGPLPKLLRNRVVFSSEWVDNGWRVVCQYVGLHKNVDIDKEIKKHKLLGEKKK